MSSPPQSTPQELWDDRERLSVEALRTHQLDRMRETLHRVYDHVPHYTRAFDAAGVRPDDLHHLQDLARFPLTSKADLRDNYPFGMFAVPREEVALLHVAYGYGLFTGGLGAHYGAERLGCTVVPVSGGMTERQVQLIDDFRPRVIMVTPSYFLAIVDEMERQGLDPARSSLEIGIFGAEPWTDEMRHEIEERCSMHAVDIYGLSEVMGPGVAQECVETKDGLHVWEDMFYPEIVDPVTGAVLPDGEEGELVFTTLTKQAMPVIRYRTRDLTRLLPGTARPSYRRMQKVTGRSDDMMIVRGVNVFPTQVEEQLLKVEGLTPHYVCVLTRPGRLDEMTVRVESRRDGIGPVVKQALAESAARLIKDHVGVTVTVEICEPHELERSLGKAKRINDQRG